MAQSLPAGMHVDNYDREEVRQALTVKGSFGGDIDSYYKALEFMRQNRERFDFDLVLGDHYALDQVTDALEKMQRYEDIKPIIVPSGG